MRENRHRILAVFILAWAWVGLWAHLPTDALADQDNQRDRLKAWEQVASLLDGGEHEQAADKCRQMLQNRPDQLEIAAGFVQASLRLCPRQEAREQITAMKDIAARSGSEALSSFLDGAELQADWRFREASGPYIKAASRSSQAGDSLSTAFALLAAVTCLARTSELDLAQKLSSRARTILADIPEGDRPRTAARALQATLWNRAGELAPADSLYRQIERQATARGYRQILCDCLNGLGSTLSKQRRIADATRFYERALAEVRNLNDPFRTGVILANLAYERTHARETAQARRHLAEARDIAETCGMEYLNALVFNAYGAAAAIDGERQTAIRYFQQAIESSMQVRNQGSEYGARQRLAYNLFISGNYSEAIAHYQRCLELSESLQSPWGLNWVLGGLAMAHHKLGYLRQAEEYYRRALVVNEELGDRMSAASCLNSLGHLRHLQGEYRQALVYNHEALSIYEEIGDREGMGDIYATLAEIYFDLGDHTTALELYEKAVALAEESGSQQLLRTAVGGMARLHTSLGHPETAGQHLERALAIARKLTDNFAIIWALNELADHHIWCSRPAVARQHLTEAVSRQVERGQFHDRSYTQLLLGRCAESFVEAIPHVQQALDLAVEGGLPEQEWRCSSQLGEQYLAAGDTAQARRYQLQAIERVESLRRNVGTDELRRHMLRPAILPYERMIAMLLREAHEGAAARGAFSFLERSRAQILASRLRAAQGWTEEKPGQPRVGEERDLLSAIAFQQTRLQEGSLSDAERAEARARIVEFENRFAVLRLRLAGQDDRYLTAMYPETADLDSLLACLHTNEIVLSYFLASPRSYLFVVRDGRIKAYPLPSRAEIETKVQLFLRLQQQVLVASSFAGGSSQVAVRQAGPSSPRFPAQLALPAEVLDTARQEVSGLLLGPAGADLTPGARLVIIPDGLLHRLPFAMLRHGNELLVDDHEIFLAPSLRTLHYLRDRNHTRPEPRTSGPDILALGCSGDGGSRSQNSSRMNPFTDTPIPRLPHADREARLVAGLFDHPLVLTGAQASESSLTESPLGTTGVLHFAAHSYADEEDVGRSFIVMNLPAAAGDDLAAPQQDGLLQWHEVTTLPLRASLVTLASCQSAGGVLAYCEGITGLTQAFLHAGSNSVLATLTDAPDGFTARFMLEFYRNLRRGLSVAAALRSTQREARTWENELTAPALWASFVLVGDGAVTIHQPRNILPYLIIAGIILLAGLVFWLRIRPTS
jgi:tetratricopeptide (TPR) repeat protein